MRFLASLASACALVAGVLAAQKPSAQRFDEFRRIGQSSSSIPLNDDVAVLLTAVAPRFGCQRCREFQPERDIVGRSWTKGDKDAESRLLFATLDFAEGRDTFVSLGLQTAPVLFLFPPTQGPHAVSSAEPLRFDFSSGYFSPPAAEQVHGWLARHLPGRPHPAIKRPINYIRWASGITFLLGIGTVAVTAGPYVLPILQNRNLWAAGTMIAILLFTSGHMFNHIRKVPYVAGDGRGGVNIFASGFQSQLGLETQIVAAMYGVLAFGTIALATRIPRMTNPRAQLVAGVVWCVVIMTMSSFLLSVFRIKNGGYPFSLPPFM
ncbi:Magnesium transporter protein 1 [Tolypocladium ophioglossoides CBS 100239]|uniref:Magnesium transporter protein 1 n=1 Tax=Tolypocladium ophioglossoides (strain CBS 100239) TaxID=1163406 RepID=A0A0L0N576_TOLOC|nr:Magnesium transporter protein 1 [Tolypocladium ophioglossoides CBS 100239]